MAPSKRSEVIRYLEDFLSGSGGAHDWDDFTTGAVYKDKELDAIALIAAKLPDIYPPTRLDQYCSEEGIEFLRRVLHYLKKHP
jgi:hypothetical protein